MERMVSWQEAMEFATAVAVASGWPIESCFDEEDD